MWNFISLNYLQYKDLSKAIADFTGDIDKLRLLQTTGHVPLILSQRNDCTFEVAMAPCTMELLSKIDTRFSEYKSVATSATQIDAAIIDSHELLLGNREAFKHESSRKTKAQTICEAELL